MKSKLQQNIKECYKEAQQLIIRVVQKTEITKELNQHTKSSCTQKKEDGN